MIDPVRRQVQLLVAHVNAAGLYVNDALAAFDRRDQFNIIDTVIGFKADLIVRKDRPFSASEFERREPVKLLGVETAVATVEDTILAKLEWWTIGGSDRQLRDVDAMIRAHRGGLDLSYLIRWGAELGVSDQLGVMLET